MSQQRKIALVTGGSRGLGKNMVQRLADKGLDVVLTYHSRAKEAEAVAAEIRGRGRKAAVLQLNSSEVSGFATFEQQLKRVLIEEFDADAIDYLINNAGIGINAPFSETSIEQFDELMNIHLKGVFFLTQRLLPIINDGGGIVNVSSGLARFALPGYSAYGAMKSAIESLTRYQAKELGARGIRSNVIAPGAIETDFSGGFVRDNEQVNKAVASMIALGRVGVPEDIGCVVAFLCTEDARWINGQRIEISGGQLL